MNEPIMAMKPAKRTQPLASLASRCQVRPNSRKASAYRSSSRLVSETAQQGLLRLFEGRRIVHIDPETVRRDRSCPSIFGQDTYRPGQCHLAVVFSVLFQCFEDGGRAEEDTGIESVEISHPFADITNPPIFHPNASHIIHVDEGIMYIAIHYERHFNIGQGMGRQGADKLRIKEMIRHEQQKRLLENAPCLED